MCYAPIVQSGGKYALKFSIVRWVDFPNHKVQLFALDEYPQIEEDKVVSCGVYI